LVADPTGGTAVPGADTNAAEGSAVVPAVAPLPALHLGTRTKRAPPLCGSSRLVAPVVCITAAALAEGVGVPVPHGATTTVRAASFVGTISARMPGSTTLLPLLLLAIDPATANTINSPTIATQTVRFCSGTSSP
jgi:hypothetical protein